MSDIVQKTIDDFGDQWGRYTTDDGYYVGQEHFADTIGPLLSPVDFTGKTVLDIGSGSGRIVRMLTDAGAAHIYALEPAAAAFETLKKNTRDIADRITYFNCRGDQIPPDLQVDMIVSIGVVHHIAEPNPVMQAAYKALNSRGRCLVWLYGREGNEIYLALAHPLRLVTVRLPHAILAGLCHVLSAILYIYMQLCKFLPLPMHAYIRKVLSRLDHQKRYLMIYDQLNPAYARYYTRQEALDLMAHAGFKDLKIHHRHGYSWTVAGEKE